MLNKKINKNGQAVLGGVLIIILLVALVVFIFFMIRRPKQPSPPTTVAGFGLSMELVEENQKEIERIEQNYPIAKILPHGESFFLIHSPSEDGIIIVDIDETVDEDFAKNEVFSWIQEQGYAPGDYNFSFRTRSFPK